jgi:hypothetical protein
MSTLPGGPGKPATGDNLFDSIGNFLYFFGQSGSIIKRLWVKVQDTRVLMIVKWKCLEPPIRFS